jgi:hypothetical protein
MILNLTLLEATSVQAEAGVVDLPNREKQQLSELLQFTGVANAKELAARAHDVAMLAIFNSLGGRR